MNFGVRIMTLAVLGLVGASVVLFVWGTFAQQEESGMTNEESQKKTHYVMTESRTVYTTSTKDITRLFNDINYSMKGWESGNYEIPRIYLTDISSRWGTQAQRIPVKTKKAIFFQLTLPLILRSNELILHNRERLTELRAAFPEITAEDRQWLQKMAKRYRLSKSAEEPIDAKTLETLVLRMNIVPPSLALAQAAEESGWGTSRFAILGNSLFGQWDFSGNGMVPEQQRKELGNYGLKRFDTPLDAVRGYMLNLNTHAAYKKLRLKRAELEAADRPITGHALAETLDKYSERGMDYVDSLHKMMNYNQLAHADEAYLWDDETIFLTPKPDPKPPKQKTVVVVTETPKITEKAVTTDGNGSVPDTNRSLAAPAIETDVNTTLPAETMSESNESRVETAVAEVRAPVTMADTNTTKLPAQ
jgi:uncharacterized FlgJ-related protein